MLNALPFSILESWKLWQNLKNCDIIFYKVIVDKDKYDFVAKFINDDLKEIKMNGVKVLCEGVNEYGK